VAFKIKPQAPKAYRTAIGALLRDNSEEADLDCKRLTIARIEMAATIQSWTTGAVSRNNPATKSTAVAANGSNTGPRLT
jgi:hypothetical protein